MPGSVKVSARPRDGHRVGSPSSSSSRSGRERARTRVVRPVHVVPGLVRALRLLKVPHRRPVHRLGASLGGSGWTVSLRASRGADLSTEPASGGVGDGGLREVGVGVGVGRGVRHVRRVLLAPFRYRRHHRARRSPRGAARGNSRKLHEGETCLTDRSPTVLFNILADLLAGPVEDAEGHIGGSRGAEPDGWNVVRVQQEGYPHPRCARGAARVGRRPPERPPVCSHICAPRSNLSSPS